MILDRGEYVPVRVDAVACILLWVFLFASAKVHIVGMFLVVTVLTQQLQVIKAERDVRIMNVSCSQMHFVVDNLSGLSAALANSVLVFEICKTASLPALRFVKLDCKWFHDKKIK